MTIVTVKSCESRTTLSFAVHSRHRDEIRFWATISGAPFTGEVLASTYHVGSPTALFDDMAACWVGWSGKKCWQAIDGELCLTATSTSLGNVTLIVEMMAESGGYTAAATLKLEAGNLGRVADEVRSLFI
jgi:hypothetical protein